MPSHSCYVPGCRSGYPGTMKNGKKEGKDNPSLFRPPKEMVEIWGSIIGRTDRKLHKSDVICSMHFKEDDIERHYTHLINGEVVLIERGIPKLRHGAVPSIFPNKTAMAMKAIRRRRAVTHQLTTELSTPLVKRKHITTSHHKTSGRVTKTTNSCAETEQMCSSELFFNETECNSITTDSNSSHSLIQMIDTSDTKRTKACNMLVEDTYLYKSKTERSDELTVRTRNTLFESEYGLSDSFVEENPEGLTNEYVCVPYTMSCGSDEPDEGDTAMLQITLLSYSELLQHAYTVSLPSPLWAIHRHPRDKYIAFVCMRFDAKRLEVDKAVVFEGTCRPLIFFRGHKVPIAELEKEITCVSDMINLLRNVEEFQVVCLLAENDK